VSSPDDGRYVPAEARNGQIPSAEEIAYADDFVVTARVVEACIRSEDLALLLSTCRNHWMTVNAAFTDLRDAVGAKTLPDPLSKALFELRRQGWQNAERALDEASMALRQVDIKLRVWEDREQLIAELEEQAAALGELRDRQRMQRLIDSHRNLSSSDHHDADGRFVALSSAADEDAELLLKDIRKMRTKLAAVVNVARAIGKASAPAATLTLLDMPPATENPDWERLCECLNSPTATDGSDARTAAQILSIPAPDPQWPGPVAAAHFMASALGNCEQLVGVIQDALAQRFRPNLSRPPMPAPYVIDLTRMYRPASGRVRDFRQELHRGQTDPAPEHSRLALLRCGVPEASYSSDTCVRYRREERNDVSRIRDIAAAAVTAAVEKKAAFLAMPECFLPEEVAVEILELAEDAGIGLIAGVEYEREQMINKVVIEIPGVAGALDQRKQAPSKYEAPMVGDHVLRKFLDTELGVLGVVVCSDYLELDILWAMAVREPRLDTLIVCSRDHNAGLFSNVAAADALRLHAHVAIVNAFVPENGPASGKGTAVFAPRREDPELTPTEFVPLDVEGWDEIDPPDVAFWDLPVAALAQRDTHDTIRGYAAAPRFVKLPTDTDVADSASGPPSVAARPR
jgi:hypothetical protein